MSADQPRILKRVGLASILPIAAVTILTAVFIRPEAAEETILYTPNLSAERVQWLVELGETIEANGGVKIAVKPAPLIFFKEPLLFVSPESFNASNKDGLGTIYFENRVGAWLKAELGIAYLSPGETERLEGSFEWQPYRKWIRGQVDGQFPSYDLRELLGVNEEWGRLNGLHRQPDRSHMTHKVIYPELFSTHPELFAKDSTGRSLRPPIAKVDLYNDQPDLLEPRVIERMAEAAINAFKNDPKRMDFSILPNDSYVFGHIPDAYGELRPQGYYGQLQDYSNYVYHYGNQVAQQVKAVFPDRFLVLHPYMNWLNTPSFQLEPNLIAPVADDRTQWYDTAFKKRDIELFSKWQGKGAAWTGIVDYPFGQGFLIPRSLTGIIGESIPLFHEMGAKEYTSFVSPLWAYDAHTTWLAAQLIWDVDQDPEELLDLFFSAYYGEAAYAMRRFFDTAEKIWMTQPGKGRWLRWWKDPHQAVLFGAEDFQIMKKLLSEAEEAAVEAGDPDPIRRIGYTREMFEVTKAFAELVRLRWAVSTASAVGYSHEGKAHAITLEDLSTAAGLRSAVARMYKLETNLKSTMERLGRSNELHRELRRTDWVFEDDPGGRALAIADGTSGQGRALFSGWEGWGDIWRINLLDTENARIEMADGALRAENVFRGFVHRSAAAAPGRRYQALVPIRGKIGPSSFIYSRLDFYDSNFQPLGSSKWDRLPPGFYSENFTTGPVMVAPDRTAYVRLYIRFFQQEAGDWVEIDRPRLLEAVP